jgi:hypothetical protein
MEKNNPTIPDESLPQVRLDSSIPPIGLLLWRLLTLGFAASRQRPDHTPNNRKLI